MTKDITRKQNKKGRNLEQKLKVTKLDSLKSKTGNKNFNNSYYNSLGVRSNITEKNLSVLMMMMIMIDERKREKEK